jgi:hypothetical protein
MRRAFFDDNPCLIFGRQKTSFAVLIATASYFFPCKKALFLALLCFFELLNKHYHLYENMVEASAQKNFNKIIV